MNQKNFKLMLFTDRKNLDECVNYLNDHPITCRCGRPMTNLISPFGGSKVDWFYHRVICSNGHFLKIDLRTPIREELKTIGFVQL